MTKIKAPKKRRATTKAKKPTVVLRDNRGQELRLPAEASIKDLIRLGIDKIKAFPLWSPLPDGWFSMSGSRVVRTARRVLEQAADAVCGDRNNSYGPPIEDFTTQAVMMSAYLSRTNGRDVKIRPSDIAALMMIVKLARQAHCPKEDNWMDAAGYAACGAEIDEVMGKGGAI